METGRWDLNPPSKNFVDSGSTYVARPRLRLLPLDGRVHFLVHSWSNNCYFEFQTAVLVAIPAA
jgi:hypothetical protein